MTKTMAPERVNAEIEWSRLRAPQLRDLASKDAVVIVPIGSTEQHGPHLPTQVDCLLVGEVARRAATRAYATVPTLITPTVWSGLAEHHMSLGATLSVDFQTFFALVRGISRSLVRHGFRNVLLLNGHGGNIAALTVAVNELAVSSMHPSRRRPISSWRSRRLRRSSRCKRVFATRARPRRRWCWRSRPSSSTCRSSMQRSDRPVAKCRR